MSDLGDKFEFNNPQPGSTGYCVISHDDSKILAQQVSKALLEGWVPCGGISVYSGVNKATGKETVFFSQAIYRLGFG